jgi:two-component system sensor histidine kinase CpxA
MQLNRTRIPLYARLLVLLFANLLLVGVLFVFSVGRVAFGWDLLLAEPVRERLLSIADALSRDLANAHSEAEHRLVFDDYEKRYQVQFEEGLFRRNGSISPSVGGLGSPARRGVATPPGSRTPAPGAEPEPPAGIGARLLRPTSREERLERIHVVKLSSFGEFLILVPGPETQGSDQRPPENFAIHIDGLARMLRFLGVRDWLLFALGAILMSAGLWWLFAWRIRNSVVAMMRVTRRIADGHLNARVAEVRSDELGELAAAINQMALRLEEQLDSQKRFVADVAHEVTSPLARIRLGLSLLEDRLGTPQPQAMQDVQEDVQEMSEMLEELLLFSRAGMEAERGKPERCDVRCIATAEFERLKSSLRVRIEVPPGTEALAYRPLLSRALSNLLRNALRYGGNAAAETIVVEARRTGPEIEISVKDRGPGVPEAALEHLGEPFFRPDTARARSSGGFGLGLAIVRRCIHSCGGSVSFHNRDGGGFEARIRMPAA